MKKILLTLVTVLALATTLSAGTVKKNYKCEDFTALSATHCFNITLIQSDTYKVQVEVDDEYAKYLSVTVKGRKLEITFKDLPRKLTNINTNTVMKATIQMPVLSALYLSGACKLNTTDAFKSEVDTFTAKISGACDVNTLDISGLDAEIDLSGASRMELNATFASVDFESSGASKIEGKIVADDIEGDVSGASKSDLTVECDNGSFEYSGASKGTLKGVVSDELVIDVSGASAVDARDLKAKNVEVGASGASRATVWVTRSLDVECSGGSTCRYYADGKIDITSDISRGAILKKLK